MIKATDRRIGFYPISIATSLAIENCFATGEFEDINNKHRPLANKTLMVNIRTLIRNAYNAYKSQDHAYLTVDPMVESVAEDMTGIVDAVKRGNVDCEVVFYYCTYSNINDILGELKYYNRGSDNPEDGSTGKQKHYRTLELEIFEVLGREMDDLPEGIVVEEFKFYLESKKPTVLLTHMPADLLSADKMPSCVLLESHTGKIKGKSEWASKLLNKPANIPFSKMTLSIFGDGVLIGPQPIKFRKVLLAIATKYKWDHRTSDTRIIEGVKKANEPHLVTFLRKHK